MIITPNLVSVKFCPYDGRVNSYHHGNLRTTLLASASALVAEGGAEHLSLRRLAAEAGVSHAAPAHHFGDRRGLFTALAAEGFDLLTDALGGESGSFLEQAVAYVRFALDHPGHYAVMFDRSLVDSSDPGLTAAVARAAGALSEGVATVDSGDADAASLAAFSLVHGFTTLWLNGAVADRYRSRDPLELTRMIGRQLFGEAKA